MKVHRLSRCRWFAIVILCLICFGSDDARGDEKNNTSGHFGIVFVGRNNLGELGKQYRTGMLFGVHAGVELGFDDSPWAVGLSLMTLVRGYYLASSSAAVDQTVDITEMSMGFRVRRALPAAIHHVVASFGTGFTASNVPLPPTFGRRHVGFYGGIGYNRRLVGEWSWGFETRYASYLDGPNNLSLFGTFTAGFRN